MKQGPPGRTRAAPLSSCGARSVGEEEGGWDVGESWEKERRPRIVSGERISVAFRGSEGRTAGSREDRGSDRGPVRAFRTVSRRETDHARPRTAGACGRCGRRRGRGRGQHRKRARPHQRLRPVRLSHPRLDGEVLLLRAHRRCDRGDRSHHGLGRFEAERGAAARAAALPARGEAAAHGTGHAHRSHACPRPRPFSHPTAYSGSRFGHRTRHPCRTCRIEHVTPCSVTALAAHAA
jgi:hypothetical protein